MRLRRKMISASGPGWAVVSYDGRVFPGRWEDQETAQREGNLGVYLLSGLGIVQTPLSYQRLNLGGGMWQIAGGRGTELRHTVFGTVQKAKGYWFATSEAGAAQSFPALKAGARWLADQWEAKPV